MSPEQKIGRAVELALYLHRGQTRRDGRTPYVAHPIRVALMLQGAGADAATVCAGLLHDAIEDTTASWDTVREAVDEEVADMVAHLTEDKRSPHAQRKADQKQSLASAPDRVKAVKLADRTDNLREAHRSGWSDAKMRSYAEDSRALLAAIGAAHPALAAQLEEAIAAVEALLIAREPAP